MYAFFYTKKAGCLQFKKLVVPFEINLMKSDAFFQRAKPIFFPVYDGHAGVKAAIAAASHLHEKLVDSEFFHTDPLLAIQDAIVITDKVYKTLAIQDATVVNDKVY